MNPPRSRHAGKAMIHEYLRPIREVFIGSIKEKYLALVRLILEYSNSAEKSQLLNGTSVGPNAFQTVDSPKVLEILCECEELDIWAEDRWGANKLSHAKCDAALLYIRRDPKVQKQYFQRYLKQSLYEGHRDLFHALLNSFEPEERANILNKNKAMDSVAQGATG